MAVSKSIRAITYACFILFIAFLTVNSFLFTCEMTPSESVRYQTDAVWTHLLTLGALIGLLLALKRVGFRLSQRLENRLTQLTALALLAALVGCVLISKSQPIFDQYICTEAASSTLNHNYYHYTDGFYLNYFPFQVPFVLFCVPFILLGGSHSVTLLQFVNVAAIMVMVWALTECAADIFKERHIRLLCWLGSLLFLPIIFYSTFIYGTLIGACFLFLGVRQLIKYLADHRKARLIWLGLFLCLASLMKMNYYIGVIAAGIVLLLDALGTKKALSAIAAALIGVFSVLSQQLIIKGMERYTGGNLSQGFPTSSWFMLGLQEAEGKEPGWYNESGYDLYRQNGGDRAATDKLAKEAILQRLEVFKNDPAYAASFFYRKTVSQWNEPSFQCLQINEVMRNPERSALALSLYEGKAKKLLFKWMEQYHWLILAGVTLWLIFGLKRSSLAALFFPLYFVGGFLFHLASEAKGQYTIIYFYTLVPYAAYGFLLLARRLSGRQRRTDAERQR